MSWGIWTTWFDILDFRLTTDPALRGESRGFGKVGGLGFR